MLVLGVDPGKEGGLAWRCGTFADARPMPIAGKEIDLDAIRALVLEWSLGDLAAVVAVVERVHAMPGQGVVSTFTFGRGFGGVLGVLAGLGVRVELVEPTRWKSVVLAGTARDKAAAIDYVRRAFPGVNLLATARSRVMHDGMADAVCIAEYGVRACAR